MSFRFVLLITISLFAIAGCDRLGLADPARDAASKEADARATGSACRHAGRAIEDCYALNPEAARAAIYAGWKEMNDYMRENKIENVKPEIARSEVPAAAAEADSSAESESASASASATAKSKK
ncbi:MULTISPECIES: hypothetical protein [unclassified Undibacterium]|uniref:hypothetical protein n=1 Tax=unclassified Undibacterium TaxID=2630295 RepID=UPI002AC8A6F3|nr:MULTISPECIES: hypothetical protein [unclassified Undibacterium]MEB0140598.1 hypothetical protein [Undibacterium sp. CCC2.1]MEB0173496.1 hypothetical protein [Undibacterium sp. CCC1.1]MEB0177602.1 hypothetical protein [Undibacterium sp. CCC3.4]MEB0216776.1 hypothetical protein [Undibacterium sp. 5I2]WPX44674.1 hypothetical protein RHM61_05450 [Undibacterium sp. CCC3.4]